MRKKYKNRYIDDVGRVIFTADGLVELLNDEKSINNLFAEVSDETKNYNRFSENNQLRLYTDELASETIDLFDVQPKQTWKTPVEYQNINIKNWLLDRCQTDIERNRILNELNMYEERNLFPLLKHLIFLVDHFRKNNVIWGIGRGSSVASFVLYLIGIHRVNSLKYNLQIEEFLR